MRKYLCTTLALIFAAPIFIYSQTNKFSSLTKEEAIAAYEGTWRYSNDTTKEVFTVVMKKVFVYDSNHKSIPMYCGAYTYERNGKTVISTMGKLIDAKYEIGRIYDTEKDASFFKQFPFTVWPFQGPYGKDLQMYPYNFLLMRFYDADSCSVELISVDQSKSTMRWSVEWGVDYYDFSKFSKEVSRLRGSTEPCGAK
ncbi:MAG: hypothetical protein LKM33_00740 [Bacteroidales bacterium]|jgi:hypothetical protein|nr:hypothetical protein [Bacteroidales bacterium]